MEDQLQNLFPNVLFCLADRAKSEQNVKLSLYRLKLRDHAEEKQST